MWALYKLQNKKPKVNMDNFLTQIIIAAMLQQY